MCPRSPVSLWNVAALRSLCLQGSTSHPYSFLVEASVQQLLHPWELCTLEGHICMITAAAVGEKEGGSV